MASRPSTTAAFAKGSVSFRASLSPTPEKSKRREVNPSSASRRATFTYRRLAPV